MRQTFLSVRAELLRPKSGSNGSTRRTLKRESMGGPPNFLPFFPAFFRLNDPVLASPGQRQAQPSRPTPPPPPAAAASTAVPAFVPPESHRGGGAVSDVAPPRSDRAGLPLHRSPKYARHE